MSAESIQTFPALQGDTLTGKTKLWSIAVRLQDGHGVIVTTHGQKDGKMQINEKIISEGKTSGTPPTFVLTTCKLNDRNHTFENFFKLSFKYIFTF